MERLVTKGNLQSILLPRSRKLLHLQLPRKKHHSPPALGTLIKAAGFPPGVFQILTSDGSTGS